MKETEAIAMRETTLSVNIEESQQSGMKKKVPWEITEDHKSVFS